MCFSHTLYFSGTDISNVAHFAPRAPRAGSHPQCGRGPFRSPRAFPSLSPPSPPACPLPGLAPPLNPRTWRELKALVEKVQHRHAMEVAGRGKGRVRERRIGAADEAARRRAPHAAETTRDDARPTHPGVVFDPGAPNTDPVGICQRRVQVARVTATRAVCFLAADRPHCIKEHDVEQDLQHTPGSR